MLLPVGVSRKHSTQASGFGVIEGMIFSTIATVFVLGTVAMVTRNSWQVRLMNVKAARDTLAATLRSQMSDVKLCSSGLINTSPITASSPRFELSYTMVDKSKVQLGSSPDEVLEIKSLRVENVVPSGLTGPLGFPMQVADAVLDAQGAGAGPATTTLRPVSLGKLYVEVDGTQIVSCFNNDGIYGAAAMACIQLGGVNMKNNSDCDSTIFQTAVRTTITNQVDAELAGPYMSYVMGQTDGRLLIASTQAYNDVTSAANGLTDVKKTGEKGLIDSGFGASNTAINAANDNRQVQVTNLWTGVNQAAAVAANAVAQSSQASNVATQANSIAQNANAVAQNAYNSSVNAVNTANLANNYATNANAVSANAINVANSGVSNANYAIYVANVANGTAQGAYNTANYANYVAGVAANTAQSSLNYGYSAYNTANAALGTATYSSNTASAAGQSAQWAQGTAGGYGQVAINAYNTAWAAINQTRNISETRVQYNCGAMPPGSCY